jgi:predicted esterase
MRNIKYAASFLPLPILLLSLAVSSAAAQTRPSSTTGLSPGSTSPAKFSVSQRIFFGTMQLGKLWREAALPENRDTPREVLNNYQRLLNAVDTVEARFRKWYSAVTHLGMARAYARLGDKDSTRLHIIGAIDNGFWNFGVMYADETLANAIGKTMLDSLAQHYETKRDRDRQSWHAQVPVVYGPSEWRDFINAEPKDDSWFADPLERRRVLDSIYHRRWTDLVRTVRDSEDKPNIIIALHGGNASYREFGQHWFSIGQMTNSYVIIPPGMTRYSENMNGWDEDYAAMDAYLMSYIAIMRDKKGNMPNIYFTGYSQGACLAMKFGLSHPDFVKGVISFSGFMDAEIDDDLAQQAKDQHLRLFAISGEHDSENYKRSIKLTKAALDRHGVPFRYLEEKKLIHELPQPIFMYFMEAFSWVKG